MNHDQNIRLSELSESLPLSRASVFEIIKALGIATIKGAGPGGRGRVAYLSSGDSERLREAVESVHKGQVRIADLAAANNGTGLRADGFDSEHTTLHDLVAAAVAEAAAKTTVKTMSDWLDAQMVNCDNVEVAPVAMDQPICTADVEAKVRFTVDLPKSLHKRLKRIALDRSQPMTDLARDALKEWLDAYLQPSQSGILFSDWISQRHISRSTAYRMRSELGITPQKRRNGRSIEVWLTSDQEALMNAYANALDSGLKMRDALEFVSAKANGGR